MPSYGHKKKRGKLSAKARRNLNRQSREKEYREVAELEKRIQAEAPPIGSNPLYSADQTHDKATSSSSSSSSSSSKAVVYSAIKKFAEMPLSRRTKEALQEASFSHMTDIQRASLAHALAGRDILGAARTGSGKTLAFVIPILELLFRVQWGRDDGVGALVISPTRELAMQIFDVLRTVGKHHNFSAGLVIGGKDFLAEQSRINNMNILVTTPGRLLQHMDETYGFDCGNIRMLVLDEADRILDMGFKQTIKNIVSNLPVENRQTLLFSATQTKSVKALASLSLKNPQYLAVHEKADQATPNRLAQHYMSVPAPLKIDLLFSFIKTHLRSKTIVFLSSCKQVRFIYECFRRMRPGIPLMHIHGKMKQQKRMALYYEFIEKPHSILFSTDLAARGLDFPNVDWVVQMDCPDSVATYIHRVGRTARYRSRGNALLFLLPSEQAFTTQLETRKIPLKAIQVNPDKMKTTVNQLMGFLASDPDLKFLAQKAFISYIRSIFLQSNKEVFKVTEMDTAGLASSFGLPGTPRLKFLGNAASSAGAKKAAETLKTKKNMSYALRALMEHKSLKKNSEAKTHVERLLARQNQGVFAAARTRLIANTDSEDSDSDDDNDGQGKSRKQKRAVEDGSDSDEDFLKVKRVNHEEDDDSDSDSDSDADSGSASNSDSDNDNSNSISNSNSNSNSNGDGDGDGDDNDDADALTQEQLDALPHARRMKNRLARGQHDIYAHDSSDDDDEEEDLDRDSFKRQQGTLGVNLQQLEMKRQEMEEEMRQRRRKRKRDRAEHGEDLARPFSEVLRERVQDEDGFDKAVNSLRVKTKHKKRKLFEKYQKKRDEDDEDDEDGELPMVAVLGGASGADDDGSDGDSGSDGEADSDSDSGDDNDNDNDNENDSSSKKPMSIADQEALALQLLGGV